MLPLLAAHLAHLDGLKKDDDAASLDRVVGAADELIGAIDAKELAAAFGANVDKDDPTAVKGRERDAAVKKLLVEAHATKASAVAASAASAASAGGDAAAAALSRLDAAMADLHKWAEPAEHWKLHVDWHAAHGRYATALKALDEHLGKEKGAPPKDKLQKRIALVGKLGWAHWARHLEAKLLVAYPSKLPPPFGSA